MGLARLSSGQKFEPIDRVIEIAVTKFVRLRCGEMFE